MYISKFVRLLSHEGKYRPEVEDRLGYLFDLYPHIFNSNTTPFEPLKDALIKNARRVTLTEVRFLQYPNGLKRVSNQFYSLDITLLRLLMEACNRNTNWYSS